jgi:hypothetical protein
MKATPEQREQLLDLYAEVGSGRKLNLDLFYQAEELRESLGIAPTAAFYAKATRRWEDRILRRLPDPYRWPMTRYMGRRILKKIRQCGPLLRSQESIAVLGAFQSHTSRVYGPYFEAEEEPPEPPPWRSAPNDISLRAIELSSALYDCLGGGLDGAVAFLEGGRSAFKPQAAERVLAYRELVRLLRGSPLVQ